MRKQLSALLAQEFPEVRGRVTLLPNGPPVPYPVMFRVVGSDPAQLYVAIYFVGSRSTPPIPTGSFVSSNSDAGAACVQNFVIYAPLTDLEFNSNSSFCGAIAGKSIALDGNNTFKTDAISQATTLPGTAPHYVASRFLDCSATTGSLPNSNC